MSKRPSLINEDQTLRCSAAVREGAPLVWTLTDHFTKPAIQAVLPLCIPVEDIVGWFRGMRVQFNFKTLLLNKSPALKVATDEQKADLSKHVDEGVERALRFVIVETCPSVVMATLIHLSVIDAAFVDSLVPRISEDLATQRIRLGINRGDYSFHKLRRLDRSFHGLPSGTLHNFNQYKTEHPGVSWGEYIGGSIYAAWLLRLKEHNADLEACYKAEHERVEAVRLSPLPSRSPASSSSSNQASFFTSPPPSTHPAASGSTPASANAGARAALLAMQLGAATAGMSPPVESAVLTDLAAVFEETFATGSKMFTVLFKHNVTKEKCVDWLDFKLDRDNPWCEAKCFQIMKKFMEQTRDLAGTERLTYAPSLDGKPNGQEVREKTEMDYAKGTASVICYLIFKEELELSEEEGDEQSNMDAVLRALVDLTTNANDTLMKELAAYCSIRYLTVESTTVVEHTIGQLGAWLSSVMHLAKRVWCYKKAYLVELDRQHGGNGTLLALIDENDANLTLEGKAAARVHNLIIGNQMHRVPSLMALFYLKSFANRYVGDNVASIDVIIDLEALDSKRELNVLCRGIQIKGVQVGRLAQHIALNTLDLLVDVFGGVDSFFEDWNPRFVDFLKGSFYVQIDDTMTASKKFMTFSYTISDGEVVNCLDLERGLESYFMSLSGSEMLVVEDKFYRALNALLAGISLLSIQRTTEMAGIHLADSPGGGVRKFRGFNHIRCPYCNELLLLFYREKDKWNDGAFAKGCLSFVHPFFNRITLAAGCLRQSFAKMVMKSRKEKVIRQHLLSHFFLTGRGDVITEGSSHTSSNFNSHVERAIYAENKKGDDAFIAASSKIRGKTAKVQADDDEDVVVDDDAFELLPAKDPIAIFTAAVNRHYGQAAYDMAVIKLAAKDQFSKAAMQIINEKLFGHSSHMGSVYSTSVDTVNETSTTSTSAEFSVVYEAVQMVWQYFRVPYSMNQDVVRVDTRKTSFMEVIGSYEEDADEYWDEVYKRVRNSDVLRRAVCAEPAADVVWKSNLHSNIIADSLIRDSLREWDSFERTHMGVFLGTGYGKSLTFLFPALFQELNIIREFATLTFVLVPRIDLCEDLVRRGNACGISVKKWDSDSMAGIMQKIRLKTGPYLLVAVIDSFTSTQSLVFVNELILYHMFRRVYVDEAHTLVCDARYREALKRFSDECKSTTSALSKLAVTFLSGTMPQDVEAALLESFGITDLEEKVFSDPHQNKLVRYIYKRVPSAQSKMDCVVRQGLACVKEGRKLLIGCVTVEESQLVQKLLAQNGVHCALNNSEERRSNARMGDDMSSWLSSKPDTIMILASTMPCAGLDAENLSEIILLGAHSVIDLKQTAGRARGEAVCVLLMTIDDEKSFMYKDSSNDTRPVTCRAESMRDLFKHLKERKCFRSGIMRACSTGYDLDDDKEGIGDIGLWTCRALGALEGGVGTRLCSVCDDSAAAWSPDPEENNPPLPPRHDPHASEEPSMRTRQVTKRTSEAGLSSEARQLGLLSATKHGSLSSPKTFSEKVEAAYIRCLEMIKDRDMREKDPRPCLYCDNSSCLGVSLNVGQPTWCPLFVRAINRKWSQNCNLCFGIDHFSRACVCTSSLFHTHTCPRCMSPRCSFITKVNHPEFRRLKSQGCASPDSYAMADRARNIIFRVSRHEQTHRGFCEFVNDNIGNEVAIPACDLRSDKFFKWFFEFAITGGEVGFVLNYVFVLLFWLSDDNEFNRK